MDDVIPLTGVVKCSRNKIFIYIYFDYSQIQYMFKIKQHKYC